MVSAEVAQRLQGKYPLDRSLDPEAPWFPWRENWIVMGEPLTSWNHPLFTSKAVGRQGLGGGGK